VALTENVAAAGAITVCGCGWAVITGGVAGVVTVSRAGVLEACPALFVTDTANCAPLSAREVGGVV
jgi:hypothetical protein